MGVLRTTVQITEIFALGGITSLNHSTFQVMLKVWSENVTKGLSLHVYRQIIYDNIDFCLINEATSAQALVF